MTDHLEAAIQAGAEIMACDPSCEMCRDDMERVITAALPDLEKHFAQDPNVRRAIIQELADEAYGELSAAFGDTMPFSSAPGWLRAKLKEAEQ